MSRHCREQTSSPPFAVFSLCSPLRPAGISADTIPSLQDGTDTHNSLPGQTLVFVDFLSVMRLLAFFVFANRIFSSAISDRYSRKHFSDNYSHSVINLNSRARPRISACAYLPFFFNYELTRKQPVSVQSRCVMLSGRGALSPPSHGLHTDSASTLQKISTQAARLHGVLTPMRDKVWHTFTLTHQESAIYCFYDIVSCSCTLIHLSEMQADVFLPCGISTQFFQRVRWHQFIAALNS